MDVTASGQSARLAEQPDDRDLDEGGLDLRPRDVGPSRRLGGSGRRRWMPLVVLGALAVALAFILLQARGATLYFKNANEAVTQKNSLGTKDFRLQGTVVGRPRETSNATIFTVAYKGVPVVVRHTGSEPAMFKPGIPVVAEGHWNSAGTQFDSHRLLVKHDANYKDYDKDNPNRVKPEQSTNK